MPQPVRPERGDARPAAGPGHDPADRAGAQRAVRRDRAREQVRAGRAARPGRGEVPGHGVPDVSRERQHIAPVPLPAHGQQAVTPVHVGDPQGSNLTGPQPQPRHGQDNRVIPGPEPGTAVACVQQPLDMPLLEGHRQAGRPAPGRCGHRASQRGAGVPVSMQEPQQRTQRGHDQLGPSAAVPRAFHHDVGHDLAGLQVGHALLAVRQPGQERRGQPQVPVRRAGRQAALGEQVVPVPGKQPSGCPARRDPHALRQRRQRPGRAPPRAAVPAPLSEELLDDRGGHVRGAQAPALHPPAQLRGQPHQLAGRARRVALASQRLAEGARERRQRPADQHPGPMASALPALHSCLLDRDRRGNSDSMDSLSHYA